jgi:hypothetical protein
MILAHFPGLSLHDVREELEIWELGELLAMIEEARPKR